MNRFSFKSSDYLIVFVFNKLASLLVIRLKRKGALADSVIINFVKTSFCKKQSTKKTRAHLRTGSFSTLSLLQFGVLLLSTQHNTSYPLYFCFCHLWPHQKPILHFMSLLLCCYAQLLFIISFWKTCKLAMKSKLLKCNYDDGWVLLFDESNIWAQLFKA